MLRPCLDATVLAWPAFGNVISLAPAFGSVCKRIQEGMKGRFVAVYVFDYVLFFNRYLRPPEVI